jgi:hypothetical protein
MSKQTRRERARKQATRGSNPSSPTATSAPAEKKPKVSIEVTPLRLMFAVVGLILLCGGAFFAARGLQLASEANPPASAAALPPSLSGAPTLIALTAPAASGATVALETFDTLDAWQFKQSAGADYKISLQNGELHGEVSGTALHNYFTKADLDNGTVELDARWVDGDQDKNARYGLVLRRTADSAFFFEYYPFQDGLWVFQVGVNDKFDMLGRGNLARDRQRSPTTFTHLRADLIGNRARLYANDTLLGEVDISRIPKGAGGVMVTADPGKRAHMAMDNFSIRK